MIASTPQSRSIAARKGWEKRRQREERRQYTRRGPQPVPIDFREELRELLQRVQLLEVSRAEHYALLRALEERMCSH